jgi:hypothetical protein
VRAIVAEILDDAFKKLEMQAAERAERAKKTTTEQAIKLKAAREAREKKPVKKRKAHRSIVSRLGKIAEPLQAIHDTAEHALAADDHETAVVVASNLSMLCLKMLEDCLNDLGDVERGYSDAWFAGEV